MSRGLLNSVLIVENASGAVFIVEKKNTNKRNKSKNEDSQKMEQHFDQNIQPKLKNSKNTFCKYCLQIFCSKSAQWMHYCQKIKGENFICRLCHKEHSKKIFDIHMNEHGSNGKRQDIEKTCKKSEIVRDSCERSAPVNCLLRRKGVRTKIKYQRKRQRFECDLCGKYLSSLRSLQFHINLHRGSSSYICPRCGLPFYTPNGVKGHSCEKKRKRPVKDFRTYDMRYCRFCDLHFSSLDENKAHKCEFQHPTDQKLICCRCCGKTLNKLAFNRHLEVHSGIDWMCHVCNKKLSTERALTTHMTTHSGNKPYPCKFCAETFINKVVLERHMRFHGQKPEKTWACEVCFKILSTETSLKSHIQRLHKNTVQCELCKLEFPNRDYLKDHHEQSHERSVCKICGKNFTLPRYLKMHEKLHYDDDSSKLTCSICSKQLTAKNIKHHVFRHHFEKFEEWTAENPSF